MENNEIEIIEDEVSENNKKKGNKIPYVVTIVMALVFVVTITVSSYAYFTATVTNKATPTTSEVTTGSMEIEFSDGPEVKLENALPGQHVVKTFSVKNTGTLATSYDIYLNDLINTFEDKTDLVYTLTSSNGANVSSQTQLPSETTKIVNKQTLPVGVTHEYTLRIDFKETNDNQDDNKNKQFSTIIAINEIGTANSSISASNLKVGDRVLYSVTGNQGQIDSWIVIKEGEEPELVSETTTPNKFLIGDQKRIDDFPNDNGGYLDAVGSLNRQAASYGTNTSVVKTTRHMGYDGQTTEVCTDLLTCPDFDNDRTTSHSPNGIISDIQLVINATGSIIAKNPSGANSDYWLAYRDVNFDNSETNYCVGAVKFDSTETNLSIGVEKTYTDSELNYFQHTIRPIITLQSNVELTSTANENEYQLNI